VIARITAAYTAVFAIVVVLFSLTAYAFVAREYASLLQPALASPPVAAAYHDALRRVAIAIALVDLPLMLVVAAASYVLAHLSLRPLLAARERERRFAMEAAHGLRTPLATIASVAQAARGGDAAVTADALETIARAALDAAALVGDLLTLARDPHRSALHREPLDLGALVATCARDFMPLVQERGIELRIDSRSAIVNGDERRLRELLRNLLENALRHARSTIRVACNPDGRHAVVTVEDDGDGIPPHDRERVFERFYRRDVAPNGCGVGLAIVRWIARAHEGEAWVRDGEAGFTTAFVIRLPLLPIS